MRSREVILDELVGLIVRLRNRKAEIEAQLSSLEAQINAVETTLKLLKDERSPDLSQMNSSFISELHDKSLIEALITIAQKRENRLIVKEAKRLLIQAGLINNAKNALSILYTTISRSGRFEKIKPGEYKVKDVEDTRRR
jgi:hypothetical protein